MQHQPLDLNDRSAFAGFFDQYKDRVYNTCLSYLQSTEDAEEIAQDVFIQVFQSASRFQGESSVSTWVYRITVNKCLDALRTRQRKKRMQKLVSLFRSDSGELQVDIPDFHHPGVQLENKERAVVLFAAINQLPETQKTAFILSQVEGLPQREIAEVMKISEKATESLLQRAKAGLRKIIVSRLPKESKLYVV